MSYHFLHYSTFVLLNMVTQKVLVYFPLTAALTRVPAVNPLIKGLVWWMLHVTRLFIKVLTGIIDMVRFLWKLEE